MTLRVTCQKLTATRSGPMYSNFWSGKSAAVITALTPGNAAAFVVSILRIRAWACGERRILPHSMPGIAKSARSEERRVGKESRCRWCEYRYSEKGCYDG